MLKPKYQDIIKLPPNFLNILRRINKIRNRVHFTNRIEYSTSPRILSDLKLLIKFANEEIKPKIDKLDIQIEKHVGKVPVLDV